MPRHPEPIDLLIAKGRSHLTQKEIEERRARELVVPFKKINPPDYLRDEKSREEFHEIAGKLDDLKIWTELDADCLARYILSKALYLKYTSLLTTLINKKDFSEMTRVQNLQDKAFKQCQSCARDLGLTITSRCKLSIPQVDSDEDYEL